MYAGGLAVADDFVRSVESLNYSGGTASDIMTLAQNAKSKTEGRLAHMSGDAAARNRVSPDNESLEEEIEYESDLESIKAEDNVVIYAV